MADGKNKASEQEKLISEFEELRSLVEKTLKEESEKAEGANNADGILVQDVEDIEEPAENGVPVCAFCGKELSKKEIASDRGYCNGCYAGIKKRPIKLKGIITALIMAVVFFGSAYTSMDAVMDLGGMDAAAMEENNYFFEGYLDYRDGRLISAEANYRKYLSDRQISYNISETAVRQLIDTYCTLGEYPYAVQIIEKYYSDFELSMPWNSRFRKAIEKNDAYYGVYSDIQTIVSANYSEQGLDYEKIVAEISALKEKYGSEAEYIIDIYAFHYGVPLEKDNEVLFNRLLELDGRYKKEESVHIPLLCHYAALMGDKAVVDDCYERMLEINCQDMSIYAAYFNYYRFLDKPDADKMLEICQQMAALSGELANYGYYNCDYLYYLAITYMVKGDAGESSFKMMQELYDTINYYGDYYKGNSGITDIFNLYALTALYTGNTQAYEWARAELEYLGFGMSDLVEKYKNGEMTLAEVIADKGGDIA